jgi:hypothetical protein
LTDPIIPSPGSPEERQVFADLKVRLRERFLRFREDPKQAYTAVIVPSQSFDPKELAKISGVAHYEERLLVHLMLLRRPRLRVVFVSSKRIDPLVVDYYLHHMRGVPSAHARRRMLLFDCDDASPRPLTEKVLERPLLLSRIREAIPDPEMAHLAVFNSTPLERTLAVQLGIPLNACDPDLAYLGTKSDGRRALRAAGVNVAPGVEGLRDRTDLVEGLCDVWEQEPEAQRMVVKLDDSFSGEGNARLDLRTIPDAAPGGCADRALRRDALRAALPELQLEAQGLTSEGYLEQFDNMGGVCELWIEGENKRSPSVQLRVNPIHEHQIVSTHDQLLGGATGQVFLGATFPADAAYRKQIQEAGKLVAAELAGRGVIGRFGVDFLAVPTAAGTHAITAVEINLRPGGTTHPFNMLKFLTDGKFDPEEGVFRTTQGRERCYLSTDNLTDPSYRGILPFDLIDRMVLDEVHVRSNETGVAFHLLGCLSEYGKLGCVAIARNLDEAHEMYAATRGLLDRMGGKTGR